MAGTAKKREGKKSNSGVRTVVCCGTLQHPDRSAKTPRNTHTFLDCFEYFQWVWAEWAAALHKKETPAEYAARLRSICQHINANFDVEGLCRKFPERVQLVVDAEGDRIKP